MVEIAISKKITVVFSQKSDGNLDHCFSTGSSVDKNLAKLLGKFSKTPKQLVQMEQLHSTRIEPVDNCDRGHTIPGSDGLITKQKGLVLMLRIADCLPICLFDQKNLAIGLLHSGWRGSVGKIFLVALNRMRQEFSTRPENLKVILGPSLKGCCNLVKAPVFQAMLPEWNGFISRRKRAHRLDLNGFVKHTILDSGVLAKNIIEVQDCTYEDDHYFSHRHSLDFNRPQGRFASLIWLK